MGKRTNLQGTRKKGCKAHIVCRQYYLYPDYCIPNGVTYETKLKERESKNKKLNQLRTDLKTAPEKVKKIVKYHLSLPTEEAHHATHQTRGSHLMAQRVNPQVSQKIDELVLDGITDTQEVRKVLNHFVRTVLCAENPPDSDDRAYFPVNRDLKNHIYKAKKAHQLSKLDQHNLAKKIEEWKKSYPDSEHFFRPYVSAKLEDNPPEESPEKFQQTLLWVHQTKWQREMLSKYGNTMTLMDATYKTTLYDLALFFITVRSNAGYIVAAEFIIQTESSEQIEEALNVVKSWNPSWSPTYFMSDYSEAEILALESAFPNTHVYLCDFHREQSWERWTKDHKHGLSKEESEILLDLLRNLAQAPPSFVQEKPQDYYYKQALDNLKMSSIWKGNMQVQNWLTNTWLSIPKVSSYD